MLHNRIFSTLPFLFLLWTFYKVNVSYYLLFFFQKSQGNGPLNRLLMAAKRKYMDTELPPQESEGKVSNARSCARRSVAFDHSDILLFFWLHLYNRFTFDFAVTCLTDNLAYCVAIGPTQSKVGYLRLICAFFSFILPPDLFQDLSQLQETWLTEGESHLPLVSFFLYVKSL